MAESPSWVNRNKLLQADGNPEITCCRKEESLASDLAFLSTYSSFLPSAIQQLETRGLSLDDQLLTVDDVSSKLHQIPGARDHSLRTKAEQVFAKNKTLDIFKNLSSLVHETTLECEEFMSPTVIGAYAYAPLVFADVERSFSDYKNIFHPIDVVVLLRKIF